MQTKKGFTPTPNGESVLNRREESSSFLSSAVKTPHGGVSSKPDKTIFSDRCRGFTLIELLVVLAIVAILSVVVILTLNPAELLKQARDSNRLSDLGTMKSVISIYLADVSPVVIGAYNKCYTSASGVAGVNCNSIFGTGLATDYTSSTRRQVDGSGWLPIDFTKISSGAPIGNLPLDPLNTAASFYAYGATSSNNGFKLSAILESGKYNILMSADGGASSTAYETGTNLAL